MPHGAQTAKTRPMTVDVHKALLASALEQALDDLRG
jgi:hypothetical protein